MDNVIGVKRLVIEGQVKAIGRKIGLNVIKVANDPKLEGWNEIKDGENVGIVG